MLHFVGYKDIVPGILSLGHTLSEIKKRARSALNEATGTRLLQNNAKLFQNVFLTGGLSEVALVFYVP